MRSQADALLARARRLLSDHRRRAKKDGAELDYGVDEIRQLIADGPACEYCGSLLSFKVSLDHKVPISRGGKHSWFNLAPSCDRCNRLKSVLTPEEFRVLLAALKTLHPVARADVERRLLAGGERYSRKGKT